MREQHPDTPIERATARLRRASLCGVVSAATLWSTGSVVYAAASQVGDNVAADVIYISLPWFLSAIGATALSTWYFAKYYIEVRGRLSRLERRLKEQASQAQD